MYPREIERWLNPDWRARIEAWWEGYDLARMRLQAEHARRLARDFRPGLSSHVAEGETGQADDGPPEPTLPTAFPLDDTEVRDLEGAQLDREGWPVWSVERVRGAQMLWGADAVGPDDAEWMVDAVRPFGLNPSKSVLDVSAGLGGSARAIANAFGAWVTGLEASPILARLAMGRSRALDLDKRAPVAAYDPEEFAPASHYDLVLADRIVHKVRDKRAYLDGLCDCVKPKGSILLLDYVYDGPQGSGEGMNLWARAEPTDVSPWTKERVTRELTQRNMDVRIAEDLTASLRQRILQRVRALTESLSGVAPDPGLLKGIQRELHLWWARLRALGNGLSFYRFVAIKPI